MLLVVFVPCFLRYRDRLPFMADRHLLSVILAFAFGFAPIALRINIIGKDSYPSHSRYDATNQTSNSSQTRDANFRETLNQLIEAAVVHRPVPPVRARC